MLAACAAPELTALRIRLRNADMTPGSSAASGLLPGSVGPSTTCGACQLPESTSAATMAIDSGLTRTLPWPIVSAARAASPAAEGADPEKRGTGAGDQFAPIPKAVTTWSNWLGESRSDTPANAVPQPSAKSALNGFSSPVPSLVNVWPPTVKEFSHEIWVDAVSPSLSSAAADTMVNAVPGTSFAASGSGAGSAPEAWRCATARTWPVEAWTATISPEFELLLSAFRAAFWTCELIVVCTDEPGTPTQRARTSV